MCVCGALLVCVCAANPCVSVSHVSAKRLTGKDTNSIIEFLFSLSRSVRFRFLLGNFCIHNYNTNTHTVCGRLGHPRIERSEVTRTPAQRQRTAMQKNEEEKKKRDEVVNNIFDLSAVFRRWLQQTRCAYAYFDSKISKLRHVRTIWWLCNMYIYLRCIRRLFWIESNRGVSHIIAIRFFFLSFSVKFNLRSPYTHTRA